MLLNVKNAQYKKLNFSTQTQLSAKLKNLSVEEFSTYLFGEVLLGAIGFGGYLEKRSIYEQSLLFYSDEFEQYRNIHLGIDIWAVEGTEVVSPIDATVHSFGYNNGHLDYGCTIILQAVEDPKQYLLFGHLSKQSLEHIKGKTQIAKGELIGWLGNHHENGGWPSHLHFQLINNLGSYSDDYPGIACEAELEFYKTNCPDPTNLIF